MLIYLPVAEMAVPAGAMIALGALMGFMSGVFGVGGGFLATPFLMLMGVPPAIAVGTQACQLVAISASGFLGHWRTGHVDVRLASFMLAGSMAGTLIGTMFFRLLQYVGQIDIAIPVLYVILLSVMGGFTLFESVRSLAGRRHASPDDAPAPLRDGAFFKSLPYKINFQRSGIHISALLPAGIGFLGGLMVSIMGIGGGFLMIPLMIYVLRMPAALVAGTSLLQIVMTTMAATLLHAAANNTVDAVLASLLIIGGIAGVEIGVRMARRLNPVYARIALGLLLLLVCFQVAGQLFIEPAETYETAVRMP